MRPRSAVACLLVAGLAGCIAPPAPRLEYVPPSAEPPQLSSAYIAQPADLIWTQLLDLLDQSALAIDQADPERGIIVASYSGKPEPYVNCGWILVLDDQGRIDRIAATESETSFDRVARGYAMDVYRDLQLKGRLVVEVMPDGDGAMVEAHSSYVLIKTVTVEDRLGRPRGRTHEVVTFRTGERGEFSKGTVCQPNGAFELMVMDALPRVTRIARPPGASQGGLGDLL
jgi:hypothetical protein